MYSQVYKQGPQGPEKLSSLKSLQKLKLPTNTGQPSDMASTSNSRLQNRKEHLTDPQPTEIWSRNVLWVSEGVSLWCLSNYREAVLLLTRTSTSKVAKMFKIITKFHMENGKTKIKERRKWNKQGRQHP